MMLHFNEFGHVGKRDKKSLENKTKILEEKLERLNEKKKMNNVKFFNIKSSRIVKKIEKVSSKLIMMGK